MNKKIVIVDYGIGNIYSVHQALLKSGAKNINVSSDANDIRSCDSLILPGVGSFSSGMSGLAKKELVEPIKEFAKTGKPILGICLGAQMLLSESEEFGIHKGLDLIPGRVIQIPRSDNFNYRVPLIGWVDFNLNLDIPIFRNMSSCESFYFVHSFHCTTKEKINTLLTFSVDRNEITALVSKDNIYGAQFHPEKSSKSGQQFLTNFINL